VNNRKVAPAKHVREIRDILGVRAADNLRNAEVILVVEGEDDRISLTALLKFTSERIAKSIDQGGLAIESLLGGSNLSYKLSQIREAMCLAHSFLDNDKCGRDSSSKAQQDGLLEIADLTLTVCQGMKESELEDLYDEKLYSEMILNKYGVSTHSPKFKGHDKWSDRMCRAFRHLGKPWSDQIETDVKLAIARLVEQNPQSALNAHKRNSFDALIQALETKLMTAEEHKN